VRLPSWLLVLIVTSGLCAQDSDSSRALNVLLFGDVNLGRSVGQELVKGNVDFPFGRVRDSLSAESIVFVNLESQLTDQGGETQHPKYNLIFCGPPAGAEALRRANISVVSTANNHAYDYRMKGLRETIQSLRSRGLLFTGTSEDSVSTFPPAIVERNGIRVGFVAYTQFVNIPGPWSGRISLFDEARVRSEMESVRPAVDLLIASFHGGEEYMDRPNGKTQYQLRFLADAGADIVVGHHPHVVQGIEYYNGTYIFRSLGNFVFYQPQLEWTQKGLGVELQLRKDSQQAEIARIRLIPLQAALQPYLLHDHTEKQTVIDRVVKLSNVEIIEETGNYFVNSIK